MKILAIETSCDETALAVLECSGGLERPSFTIKADALHSQTKEHAPFGGVFPALAKREHAKNLIPLFLSLASPCRWRTTGKTDFTDLERKTLELILKREPELLKMFLGHLSAFPKPAIDLITVTQGPGLEPALWVGINFVRALSYIWKIPIMPANHMEGHIYSVLLDAHKRAPLAFPLVALLISGGHTELVLAKHWDTFELLGSTRDDAVGEAFDKVARLLSLPYPGGPHLSRLAREAREKNLPRELVLPRPMLSDHSYEFSFSGLKTAVRYALEKMGTLTENQKQAIAREFEDSVADVLVAKSRKAIEDTNAQTFIVGGGVIANIFLREKFKTLADEFSDLTLHIPTHELSTDNAVMIAISAYIKHESGILPLSREKNDSLQARGTLSLHHE